MSKKVDISTMYTKEENRNNGRKGYYAWKKEKEDIISPKDFGKFLMKHRKGRVR